MSSGEKEEKILNKYLSRLGFGVPSRNKSGYQSGFDVGWDLMSEKIKWHLESKGYRNRRDYGKIISEISIKLTQSIAGHGTDFQCWCIFTPYLRLDLNEIKIIEDLEKYYIFPYKIVIWDKNYKESYLDKIEKKEAELVEHIRDHSNEGLFRNKLFKKVLDERRDLAKKNIHKIYITPSRQSGRNDFYKFEIFPKNESFNSSRKIFSLDMSKLRKNDIKNLDMSLGKKEESFSIDQAESKEVKDAKSEIIIVSDEENKKAKILLLMKNAKNDKGTLFDCIGSIIKSSKGFCVFEIETEESLFLESPFYLLDSIDFSESDKEIHEKELNFHYLTENLKNKLFSINKIIHGNSFDKNKDKIVEYLRDNKLKYYFLDKLPEKFDNLKTIDFILKELIKESWPHPLFQILENNISSKNNFFILSFIFSNYNIFSKSSKAGGVDRSFQERSLELIQKIIKSDKGKAIETISFIKNILKQRDYKKRDIFDRKDNIEREKNLVAQILLEISKEQGIDKELIDLIKNNFDLISDQGRFSHHAPSAIFEILRNYILKNDNFEGAFEEITEIVLEQYHTSESYKGKDGKNKFEGYERYGGGISQGGSHFSISDSHFVEQILKPTFSNYYQKNPKEAVNFINSFCICKKEGKIILTKNNPDFLLRTSIDVLLKEYKKDNLDAENTLIEFLKIRRGIPSKDEIIFQSIHNNAISLPNDKKWKLIQKQISLKEYSNLPANIFVLKIIADLIKEENFDAIGLVLELSGNGKLYEHIWHSETVIIEIIENLIHTDLKKGVKAFKTYINTNFFKNGMGTFDAYPASYILNDLLQEKDSREKAFEILNELVMQEDLTKNQQILVCNSLTRSRENSDSEDRDTLLNIYDKFVWPLLDETLKGDLKKDYRNEEYGLIYKKFPFSPAREGFIKFSERLAKKGEIKKALDIVKIFINDPDPFTPLGIDPEDPKKEYDEHEKIKRGEETMVITTIRGWCGWVILQCSGVESRPFIKEMIELSEKLLKDENLYVSAYGTNALSSLVLNRLTVCPDNKNELFFGNSKKEALENAKKVEDLAFEFLKRIKKEGYNVQSSLASIIIHLFDYLRALNQSRAKELINSISEMSPKLIAKTAPLFIFFAEFRKDFYKDWKWEMKGLYDDLGNFESRPFQEKLEAVLKIDDSDVRSSFAWQLYRLINESAPNGTSADNVLTHNRAFEISYKYLKISSKYYDGLAFSHIHRFIEENFDRNPEECYELFNSLLKTEREALLNKKVKFYDWYPRFTTGEILTKIKEQIGIEESLKTIEFLLGYPNEIRGRLTGGMVDILNHLPERYNERIKAIFNELTKIDPRYFDIREEWIRKKNK